VDGQVAVTQEETEAMFGKITSIMEYLKNSLVNNTELAKQVASLQAQVSDLTAQVANAVGTNTALQEAVNVLQQERDTARQRVNELEQSNSELSAKFTNRDNDANHWYAQYQAVSAELERVKNERSELETEHLKLIEENDKAKAQLEKIKAMFNVPIVEEVKSHETPQPRDPVTQQWQGWPQQQVG